jgi:PAS domain S-box-containing protein
MDRIGAGHGLLEREVRGIIEDDQGYFWMPSDRGILRASRKQLHAVADDGLSRLELQVLDQHDGLPSPECSTAQPNCARDTAGKLWFATQKGPAVIDPAAFRLNAQPPPVQVERLTYHVRKPRPDAAEPRPPTAADSEFAFVAPFPSPLRIPPGAYSLDFEFAALSFSAPEKVQFQYLLEGQSQGWLDSRKSRRVSFHRLPPGDYVLRVRAANSDGVWNETGAVVAFSVLPFFWQTWSFQLATGFLLVALGGVSVWSWYYRKLARAEEWERSAIALRASHARLELASELAGLGYYEVDYGMRTCFLDNRFREICGVPAELMQGLDPVAFWLEHVCPEHRGRISEERQKLREGKTDQISAEYRYRHPTLGEIWLHHNARVAERHPGGAGLRTFGVIRDITETRRTAEQLEEDSRYATLIAGLSSRFVNLSPGEVDGAIEDAQRRVCEFLGLDLSALWQPVEGVPGDYQLTHHYRSVEGPPITRMSAGDNFPWCQQQLLAGKVVVVASMDNLPSEAARDQEVWRHYGVKTSLTLPLSTWGSPAIGFLSFNDIRKERDWSEALVQRLHLIAEIFTNALARKRSDEGLRESLEINRATFEQAAAGIAHVAPDGHWLRVNDRFCAIVGHSREELMRLTFQDITHPDDLGKDLEHLRLMLAGEITTYAQEKRYFRKDRSLVWVNLTVSLVRTDRGDPKYFISVVEDITGRRRAEEEMQRLRLQLWHADRVAQTGAITASLAHELNQPLTGILSTAQAGLRFLGDQKLEPSLIREIFTNIVQDTKRAGSIINGLRSMLRRKETGRELIDLAETIQEVLGLAHSEMIARQVECSLRLEPD